MPQFHETGYGSKFFNVQMPQLISAIEGLTDKISSKEEEVSVVTPAGKLVVDLNSRGYYPGIWIELEDENGIREAIACVEYFEDQGIRTLSYVKGSDDPEAIIQWDDKWSTEYHIHVKSIDSPEEIHVYSASTENEAVGKFLIDNEALSYSDIITCTPVKYYASSNSEDVDTFDILRD